jgi:hypothetical protein
MVVIIFGAKSGTNQIFPALTNEMLHVMVKYLNGCGLCTQCFTSFKPSEV